MAPKVQFPRLRTLIMLVICGIGVSLITGFFENMPDANIIGAQYYGFPLYWRVSMIIISLKDTFLLTNLAVDIVFWFLAILAVFTILGKVTGEKTTY